MSDLRRYRIVHTTAMSYAAPVRASHNELRMSPLTDGSQTTLENRIRVRPISWSHVYRDHWGSHVTAMESVAPHDRLDIEATSTVECTTPAEPPASPGWEALEDPVLRDRRSEWLIQTRRTLPADGIAGLVEAVRPAATPREAAYRLGEVLRERVTYEKGVTGVHGNAEDALRAGRGVCQDFAHIALGALRALRMPARYVSGYLVPERGLEVGRTSQGESHAWVELWDGGWVPLDPTNGIPVALEHVVVARGRDYDDVPPVKGVYAGQAESALEVTVRVTRLA